MNHQEILDDPCPACGSLGHLHRVHREETVEVRGQAFVTQAEFFHCDACNEDFESADSPDTLAAAYRAYREVNGLLPPETLKDWRRSLGLRQAELALLLGWSTATVSRYENGALQDDAHDRALRAAMSAGGLNEFVRSAKGLSEATLERLRHHVDAMLGSASQLTSVAAHRISHAASKTLDWHKVSQTLLFFAQGNGVSKTKLNKLLFYADFLHAKHFGTSVTGLSYVRLPHGPVPDGYELLFQALNAEGLLDITETLVGEHVATVHRSRRSPDIGVFTTSEMQALIRVQSAFERTSAKDISERSHREDAWTQTPAGKPVSLVHAKTLSLDL